MASLTLTPASATVQVSETLQVTAIAKDASGHPVSAVTVSWMSSDASVATVSSAGLVTGAATGSATIRATGGGATAAASFVVTPPVTSMAIAPDMDTITVRRTLPLRVILLDAAGDSLTGLRVRWRSNNPAAALPDSAGLVTAVMADTATITASTWGHAATASLRITPSDLPIRGLYVQFERRGWASEYWSGQVLQQFDSLDPVVGTTVATEVGLQLDVIHSLGVNTISYELRSSDSVYLNDGFQPPTCNISPALGMRYPQPTPTELGNLVRFFDLVQSKGMHVLLRLVNTHMEERPPTNNTTWLGAILGALRGHPALELVLFDGNAKFPTSPDGVTLVNTCNLPGEAPLYAGPTSVGARYVQWVINYAGSLGFPARQLSAEAIVGGYETYVQVPVGGDATDFHLWDPLWVLKGIFDALNIPDGERTYGVSFYEHRKCSTLKDPTIPCVDVDPDRWADSTLARMFAVIGLGSRARIIAGEMGYLPPVDPSWSTTQAFQSLLTRIRRRGMDGGAFWRWVSFSNSEDSDPTLADPVKRRGVAFVYNPVKDALVQMYQSP